MTKLKLSRLEVGALALLVTGVLGCGTESSPEPREVVTGGGFPRPSNVLLITIDTLRADHLSCYGYPRTTSPVLDRLAAEGLRFDQPVAQWPKTGPSFASIFTATYPKDNGIVRRVGRPVKPEFRMMAEELREQGYSTHAVVANGALGRELHYDQGFDTYVETWKRGEEIHRDNRGEIVTRFALDAAADIDPARPFFLWVHYIDPHFPYEPPEEWKDRFQDDEWFDPERQINVRANRRKSEMRAIGGDEVLDGRTDHAFYVARYDAEIAYVDDQVGVFLKGVEERGLLENTMTVVTSDHGESLGEHEYYFGHGRFSFQTCLRVPLIVHYPGVITPGVDPEPVELIHLAPTILDVAGVALEDGRWKQGSSLVERFTQAGSAGRVYAFAEAGYPKQRRWQKIVRDGRFKLIHAPDWADQRWITGQRHDPFAFYDLEEDPMETADAAEAFPQDFKRLKRELHKWWNAEPFPVDVDAPDAERGEEGLDEKTREQLKALGYLN